MPVRPSSRLSLTCTKGCWSGMERLRNNNVDVFRSMYAPEVFQFADPKDTRRKFVHGFGLHAIFRIPFSCTVLVTW
jgi:hypothetical protein